MFNTSILKEKSTMSQVEQQSTDIKLIVPWGYVVGKTYGPSTGERVLMVHGLHDNSGTFTRLMKYLPTNFYYVNVDLPSHGLSSQFPPFLSLAVQHFVHTIYFILEALQWKTCIYIGHSMGAQLGIMFSVFQPQRFKKIIAIDGFLPEPSKNENLLTHFHDLFVSLIKSNSNIKPPSYTKEEVLHAYKNKRYATLNTEAANAMLQRAVIEVNGKYIYNKDIRLRNIRGLMNLDQIIQFVSKLSVPIYLFITSHGLLKHHHDINEMIRAVDHKKTIFQIIYIDGNHDAHNNNPEEIAPIICKLLNSNISKL